MHNRSNPWPAPPPLRPLCPPPRRQRAVLELEYRHANYSQSGTLTAGEWGMYLVAFAPEPSRSDLVKRAQAVGEAIPSATVPLEDFFLFTELMQRLDALSVSHPHPVLPSLDCAPHWDLERRFR